MNTCPQCKYGMRPDWKKCPECGTKLKGSGASAGSLIALTEKWERLAASWMQVARERNDDAPDIANRAQARAAIYQDCTEDLKANSPTRPQTPA